MLRFHHQNTEAAGDNMWIKASEVQKGDKVFSLGIVESVTIGGNDRITIYASERNVSCDSDSHFWVESLIFQPAF